MMYHGWMWGNGWGGAGWVVMGGVMVLFWAAVITAIVFAIRYAGGSRDTASGPPNYGPSRPEEVLAERFARGEIDADEYRRRVTLLHEHR
jgi:putative membrane protein